MFRYLQFKQFAAVQGLFVFALIFVGLDYLPASIGEPLRQFLGASSVQLGVIRLLCVLCAAAALATVVGDVIAYRETAVTRKYRYHKIANFLLGGKDVSTLALGALGIAATLTYGPLVLMVVLLWAIGLCISKMMQSNGRHLVPIGIALLAAYSLLTTTSEPFALPNVAVLAGSLAVIAARYLGEKLALIRWQHEFYDL